jgi:hypothetical protein
MLPGIAPQRSCSWGNGGDVRLLWKSMRRPCRAAAVPGADCAAGSRASVRFGARSVCAVLFLAGIWTATRRPVRAQQGPTESEVKAAYLLNFLKFVDWPEEVSRDPQPPWVLGVLGDTPVGEDLRQLAAGKSIRGRELEVKKFTGIEQLKNCQILFIGSSEKKHVPAILAALRGASVLTVADVDHFVESGGMIQFVIQDSRVRVAIDVGAASRGRLKVSSKLLSLAVAVVDNGGNTRN